MRRHAMIAALAMAGMAVPAIASSPDMRMDAEAPAKARRARLLSPMAPERFKRSKGAQAKPKRKPNRLTIGKRVRRKHRRAAA